MFPFHRKLILHPATTTLTFMEIKSLESVSVADLAAAFNTAFAGYFVTINFSLEGMEERIRRARIDLRQSVGVFVENELVAFMLTGVGEEHGKKMAYNAGTGVVPDFRRRRLVQQMYEWAEPRWRTAGFTDLSLEVIVENEKAIRAYERVGFSSARRLAAWQWEGEETVEANKELLEVPAPDWSVYEKIRPFTPSWDYNRHGIQAIQEDYRFFEWREEEKLRAYAIINKGGRIAQAGCAENTITEWKRLLSILQRQHSVLSWINIDLRAEVLLGALSENHWKPTIEQFEMFRSL